MTPDERAEFDALIDADDRLFYPTPGPQMDACDSEADIVGYGGAAGGGKSYLVTGVAVTQAKRALIIRQEKVSTRKFVQDIAGILGTRDGYSSQTSSWSFKDKSGVTRTIEFAGMENEGDEEKQQGVDYDHKFYDEATQMRETQVRYTLGWVRSADPKQRCRAFLTFNPPTTPEGRWVVKFFAPWLDKKHPNPAKDGELRWFATVGDNPDFELPVERRGEPFVIVKGQPCYEFNADDYLPEEIIVPKSRTFITARVTDNPYYMATGYMSQLQGLPEPLRSQMLKGDFGAGVEDAANQLIPTSWIEAAMDRWRPRDRKEPMDSMGVDAARGGNMGSSLGATGKDKMIIARRHGQWFDNLVAIKGVDVRSGQLAAAQVLRYLRDNAPVHLDVAGIGTSPYDFLTENNIHVEAINNAAASLAMDRTGLMRFVNLRAEMYWRFMEALDPLADNPIALPDDTELLADLAAITYKITARGIQMESKDEIKKRLMRSTDKGDAVVMANISTPKRRLLVGGPVLPPGFTAQGQSWEAQRLKELE